MQAIGSVMNDYNFCPCNELSSAKYILNTNLCMGAVILHNAKSYDEFKDLWGVLGNSELLCEINYHVAVL